MVTARFPPHVGGTEIHTYELARRLVERGVDVTILTTELDSAPVSSDSRHGFPVVRVSAWPSGRDWYVAPGIGRVIRGGQWDLVHVQGIHTMVLPVALWAARRARLPYVITLHSGGHSSRVRRALRQLGRRALARWIRDAARIIAVSEFERDVFSRLLRLPQRDVEVIPSGIDRSSVREDGGRDEGILPELDAPLIVSVGRLEKYKGHDRILRALPGIATHFPGVRLVILGTGPDERRLRRLAADLAVGGRVEMVGIPIERRSEVYALLDQAALVVALSAYESQGLAALEAVARGRSVLVADSSGLRELVTAGFARGVPLGPPEKLEAAVVRQLREPHRPSRSLPTWDECATRTLDVYRSALQREADGAG
jgi:glycosyltransferase involved in cell wall biosynthesis